MIFEHRHDPLRVVIAGGGVAALEALLALRDLAPGRVAPVLIADQEDFLYRPLLVGEPFGLGRPRRHRLADLCADHGAELIAGRVTAVAPGDHQVAIAGRAPVDYDELIVATGARPYPAFEDGVTFDRDLSGEEFDEALADLAHGLAPHVAIVVPTGVGWTLPAYELALLTAAWGARHHADEHRVTLLTPERAPLEAFGAAASREVGALLDAAGVALFPGVHADVVTASSLRAGGSWMDADRIVSLPLQAGPRIAGLPCDEHGFIPSDARGRVAGVDDVHVAGDAGTFAVKQGGLAAQQAEAVAVDLARRAGALVAQVPSPRVLRGVLLTEHGPRFLRAELGDPDGTSELSAQPLWWPPTKIASRRLAPYLARLEAEGRGPGAVAMRT
ncbi:MAG TPA: FAD-dependent oxidoreductase [Baekduia sp.]|uniref:FAD-dependent oxidoreductase n=1 Tax=Baekduia sp. TaxID=2600305 RepID=UPI002D77B7D4|nr:FAD-dependent oxidoreductase [Baekduia sp.]HET6508102.1 FAD-dependent oxidoreductase [Baekduia sp.]